MKQSSEIRWGLTGYPKKWWAAVGMSSMLLPAAALSQQLSPNPNPAGNTITVANPNTFNGQGVSFENLGNINIIPGGTLINDGDFFIDPVGRLTNEDTLENNSLLINFGLFENLGGQVLTGNGTFINQGVVTNEGIIEGPSVSQNFRNVGTWQGGGSQSGQFEDVGDLAPGTDGTTGVLAINGNYSKDGGRLLVDLAGPGGVPGVTHDRVDVSGAWSFSGNTTLDVQIQSGYVPRFEDSFILGSAESFDGFFTNTILPMTSDPSGFWEIAIIGDSGGPNSLALSTAPPLALATSPTLALSGGPSFLTLKYSTLLGDLNFDGFVNDDDVEAFSQGLNDPSGYELTYGYGPRIAGDLNVDGVFNFSDIEPFVGLLSPSAVSKLEALVPEPGTATLFIVAAGMVGLRPLRRG